MVQDAGTRKDIGYYMKLIKYAGVIIILDIIHWIFIFEKITLTRLTKNTYVHRFTVRYRPVVSIPIIQTLLVKTITSDCHKYTCTVYVLSSTVTIHWTHLIDLLEGLLHGSLHGVIRLSSCENLTLVFII